MGDRVEVRGTKKVEVRTGIPGRPQNNIQLTVSATEPENPQANDLWVVLS